VSQDPTQPAAPAPRRPATQLEEGLAAFAARQLEAAHHAFERAHRLAPRDAGAMSWYGVTLVLVEKNINLGMSLCDQAVRHRPDPEHLLNQARVHLALRQRERAVRSVERGLELWPEHPALLAARLQLGTRRPAVLPFIARANPVNRFLGRLRHRWQRRHAPVGELSPVALGTTGGPPVPPSEG
jgi:tetratricopeptide (TPR) repeat protein